MSAFDPSRRELAFAPQDEGLCFKPFLHPEEGRRSVSKGQEMAKLRLTQRSPQGSVQAPHELIQSTTQEKSVKL